MDENDVKQAIDIDPLFIAYATLARDNNMREPSSVAHTGKVLKKIGRYTMLSHCFMDCKMIALRNSHKTCWQFIDYLARNTIGIGRNKEGAPKLYMKYKPTCMIKDAKITGVESFYRAKEILEDKRIIYFRENKIHLNIFPLTWNIDNEQDKNEIEEIVRKEIDKIRRNGNRND